MLTAQIQGTTLNINTKNVSRLAINIFVTKQTNKKFVAGFNLTYVESKISI